MENEIYKSVRKSVKNWWLSLLIGIICVGVGIWCIIAPGATFLTLSIFLSQHL